MEDRRGARNLCLRDARLGVGGAALCCAQNHPCPAGALSRTGPWIFFLFFPFFGARDRTPDLTLTRQAAEPLS